MKKRFNYALKDFMLISVGKAGVNIRLSKFVTLIMIIFMIVLVTFLVNIIIMEVSQRNMEIERHRRTIKQLQEDIREQQIEIEEIQEFRRLLDAIKTLSEGVLNEEEQLELTKVIYTESKKYKFSWKMIVSVIMTESSFRARIRSSDPSYGLMQIKYRTAREAGDKIGVELGSKYELFDITKNVLIGAYYLFEQILRFDNVKKGIVAYNLGPTKTATLDKIKGGGEISTVYLKRIMDNYNYLKENF